MPPIHSLLRESRLTLILAAPLIVGQLGQMLIGLCDTLMIGRVGVVPLAASTFANVILHMPFMFGIGMAMAVSVRVSQARGAKDPSAARGAVRHGLYLAILVGILTVIGALLLPPLFPYFGQEPDVIAAVPGYFLLAAISFIPANAAMVLKNHSDAMNRPWPAFWIMIGGVGANIFLNWVFIYGNLGAPRMELEGAGLATIIARLMTFIALIVWMRNSTQLKGWVPLRFLRMPSMKVTRNLLKIGIPASLQLLAECTAFVALTIIIGTLGSAPLAAHQVAISCVATIFMIPLGLSMALTVRIGEAWGAKEFSRLRPIVISGWLITAGFILFTMQGFFFANHHIASWFLVEPEAAAMAASLIFIGGVFQMSDALQIIVGGSLRGLDDVKVPAWLAVFAYWIVSIPIGWFMTFKLDFGAEGMWWGLTLGLTTTAVLLGVRLWRKTGPPKLA